MALMMKSMGGRREEAIALLQQFIQRRPLTGGQLKKAFRLLDELQDPGWGGDEKKEERARTAFDKAATAYRKGEYGHASDYFGQASSIVDSPDLIYNQAQALRKMGGRRDDVIALYEKYLASNPQGRHRADAERALRALRDFGAMP
jgi:tetratricopeptide (TPR) repeat protein